MKDGSDIAALYYQPWDGTNAGLKAWEYPSGSSALIRPGFMETVSYDGANGVVVWEDGQTQVGGTAIMMAGYPAGTPTIISTGPSNHSPSTDGTWVVWRTETATDPGDIAWYNVVTAASGTISLPGAQGRPDVDSGLVVFEDESTNGLRIWSLDPLVEYAEVLPPPPSVPGTATRLLRPNTLLAMVVWEENTYDPVFPNSRGTSAVKFAEIVDMTAVGQLPSPCAGGIFQPRLAMSNALLVAYWGEDCDGSGGDYSLISRQTPIGTWRARTLARLAYEPEVANNPPFAIVEDKVNYIESGGELWYLDINMILM